jgi:hypothetical protein
MKFGHEDTRSPKGSPSQSFFVTFVLSWLFL